MILIFKGFDGLTDEAKKERIKRAIEIIEGIKKVSSPQPLPKGEREQNPHPNPLPKGEREKDPSACVIASGAKQSQIFFPCHKNQSPLPVAMASRNGSPVPLKRGGGTISTRGEGDKKGRGSHNPAELAKNLEKLKTPLQYIKGIGPKFGERLAKKGLSTVEDVLYYLPMRYEDRRNMKKIAELSHGQNEVATGEVMASGEAFTAEENSLKRSDRRNRVS